MSKTTHSPASLFQYKKTEANKLGLTVREFEANFDIYETYHGYSCRKKDHVIRNEKRQRRKEEQDFYDAMDRYHRNLGY